ncbi:MAG: signal peptide peptidase SppA, partial [Aeromonas sp.]
MSIFKGLGWLCRSLWRLLNFTRLMLINLLFLFIVLILIVSISPAEPPAQTIDGALTLNLNGPLVEQRTQTAPTLQLLRQMESSSDDQPSEIVLSELLWAINSAKTDPRIKALVIKPQGL